MVTSQNGQVSIIVISDYFVIVFGTALVLTRERYRDEL